MHDRNTSLKPAHHKQNLHPNRRSLRGAMARSLAAHLLATFTGLCLLAVGLIPPAAAQTAPTAPTEAPATVLNLVRWSGTLPEAQGRTVELQFALYQDPAGGLALWSEQQAVKVGADGRYSVLLGATNAEGLPKALFQGGAARWIEAKLVSASGPAAAGETVSPRTLLAAVPYAFKAADAETLAGRAAEDYVTQEDLKSAVAAGIQTVAQPNTQASPTGSGTSGFVPVWTGTSTLGNSVIAESGTKVGIATAVPATTLDVNGASTLRGAVSLPAAAATAAAGASSPSFQLGAGVYSSTAKAAVAEKFVWQAASSGNNTANPSASLELLFGSGTTAPAATGLSIAPTGQIAFAKGQTFPGTGTINGVTAGTGLKSSGTSSAVSLSVDPTVVPLLNAPTNTFNGNQTVNWSLTAGAITGADLLLVNPSQPATATNFLAPRTAPWAGTSKTTVGAHLRSKPSILGTALRSRPTHRAARLVGPQLWANRTAPMASSGRAMASPATPYPAAQPAPGAISATAPTERPRASSARPITAWPATLRTTARNRERSRCWPSTTLPARARACSRR